MKHRGTVPLETARLTLRRFTIGDAPAMYANWASDDEVTRYLRFSTHRSVEETRATLADFIARYADPRRYHWAITLDSEPIGAIAATVDEADARADVAYMLGRAWWGNGYASEALAAVLAFLFEEVGVNRVEAYHAKANPASGRVMEKAGMRREGEAPGLYRAREGFQDCFLYGLTREQYEHDRKPPAKRKKK